MSEDIALDMENFVKENKGRKFHNSDVDQKYYDKVLERKQNKKRTNVRAIKSVYKLVQYHIAELMVGNTNYGDTSVSNYVHDICIYNTYKSFMDMFTEIEYETPSMRILNDPKIERINNDFYVCDSENKIKIDSVESTATYYLLTNIHRVNINCWENFEYYKTVPINSVPVDEPIIVTGTVVFDKKSNIYCLSDIKFKADYNISNISIVARYSGLGRSAWIYAISLYNGKDTLYRACDWPGDQTIQKGRVYLVNGSNQTVASIKGDWDGYYNSISFDKLKTLLDNLK